MRLFSGIALPILAAASAAYGASWGFEDATLTVQEKGAGVGGGVKEKLSLTSALSPAVSLSGSDSLKIVLTTTEGKTGKKPHQAFLTLHEPSTGLEESFPFTLKDNGKGKVEVSQKDLPFQFLTSTKPARASIILASFGSTTPIYKHVFDLDVTRDVAAPLALPPAPERYTSKPEINHIFKADAQSPPKIISGVFMLAVLFTLPALMGMWVGLGGNFDHAGKAFGASPIAHSLFFGSIVAMEGVFFLYYYSWTLFQTLPVAGVVAIVAYVSGSRALTEVQERRLAGQR